MSLQKKYILVVNPISGDVDKAEIIETATAFAENENIDLIVFDYEELLLNNHFSRHIDQLYHRMLMVKKFSSLNRYEMRKVICFQNKRRDSLVSYH